MAHLIGDFKLETLNFKKIINYNIIQLRTKKSSEVLRGQNVSPKLRKKIKKVLMYCRLTYKIKSNKTTLTTFAEVNLSIKFPS